MFYEFRLTIPANTSRAEPAEDVVEVSPGRVVAVEIQFPPGCAALAHVAVLQELHQLWPTNPDGDIAADGASISFQEDHLLDQPPFQLTLRGWNEDDTYPHTITFRFNVLPVSPPPPAPPAALEYTPIGTLEIP